MWVRVCGEAEPVRPLPALKTTRRSFPWERYNFGMQFLSLSRRRTAEFPPEAFTPELVAGEGNRVKELYAAGAVRQIWRRGDTPGAAIVWEAGSEAEVREALATFPLAVAGLLEIVAVVPLEPYAGFGPAK